MADVGLIETSPTALPFSDKPRESPERYGHEDGNPALIPLGSFPAGLGGALRFTDTTYLDAASGNLEARGGRFVFSIFWWVGEVGPKATKEGTVSVSLESRLLGAFLTRKGGISKSRNPNLAAPKSPVCHFSGWFYYPGFRKAIVRAIQTEHLLVAPKVNGVRALRKWDCFVSENPCQAGLKGHQKETTHFTLV